MKNLNGDDDLNAWLTDHHYNKVKKWRRWPHGHILATAAARTVLAQSSPCDRRTCHTRTCCYGDSRCAVQRIDLNCLDHTTGTVKQTHLKKICLHWRPGLEKRCFRGKFLGFFSFFKGFEGFVHFSVQRTSNTKLRPRKNSPYKMERLRVRGCLKVLKSCSKGAFPIHLFKRFCCRMRRLVTMHSVTDGQTDRHHHANDHTACSTIGQ